MAAGATVEVVAVSSFPSGPKTWWRPDGTLLDEAPVDPSPYPYRNDADENVRVILVRVSNLPHDAYLRWATHI